jgi:SWI/SNF-related matrix-associated actin-dependent regulator of chromatin subfamily A member 5
MIQHGAENIFQSTESTISSLDIEEIISRSEKKTAELSSKFGNMGLDDLQRFGASQSNAYEWEGEDFRNNVRMGVGRGGVGCRLLCPCECEGA